MMRSVFLIRLVAGIGGLAAALTAANLRSAAAQHGETATTCTNVASGANWQIRIDYDRATVDSNPARISDAQISWRDASDGGNYTLDCRFPPIADARALESQIISIVGVVDCGLFVGRASAVIVAATDGIHVMNAP